MKFKDKIKLKSYENRSFLKKILAKSRLLTHENRALPDFLIIGTQKGGTTSLYRYLSKHPNIKPNYVVKELSFFDQYYQRGIPWYKAHFPKRKRNNLYFEATTHYIFHPHAPKRIKENLPNIKIIVLLRDPIFRAFSSYQHQVRAGRENLSFDEAIKLEENRLRDEEIKIRNNEYYHSYNFQHFSYLERGMYAKQIKNWLRYFPISQFKFIKSEDFYSNTQKTLEEICNFLDINSIQFDVKRKFNSVSYDEKISPESIKYLKNHYYKSNLELIEILGENFSWD